MKSNEDTRTTEAGVPLGPIESDPIEAYRGWRNLTEAKGELLTAALAGVDLGHYDRRIFAWTIHTLDQPTLVTIVSLIERAHARSQSDGYGMGFTEGYLDGEAAAYDRLMPTEEEDR